MRTKVIALCLSLISAFILFVTAAQADGIIIPDPPICDLAPCPPRPIPISQLVIRYHHVSVEIQDQIATTHVDQVFYNPNDWPVEGTYIFPIPADAAVTSFTMWVDGRPVEGEVLEADEARRRYEEIVRQLKDPALLEYIDRGAVQARIFPILPHAEQRIELEYSQVLTSENGLVRYIYPLNTEKFSVEPLESVVVSVDVRSTSAPIRAVYSPSHKLSIERDGDHHVVAGYEDRDVRPDTDLSLYYSLGEEQAFHLITYRNPYDAGDPDGFFMLLLAPRPDAETRSVPKDVLLVLDRSGSMDGEKFRQAQQALGYILSNLNPEDRFNIITFSTGVEMYARSMRPAVDANEAISWVNRLSAQGSTDINRALLEATALLNGERPAYLIFLTDGLPTEGVIDSQMIVDNLYQAAPQNLRLFAFGVGYDVDTYLLDSLAREHHGTSSYVLPGDQLDEILSAFYNKISTPVLTDIAIDFSAIPVYDLYPNPLPDMFAGTQIVLVGRYRETGRDTLTLTGYVNGQLQTFEFPNQEFPHETSYGGSQSALPRLWATRKIGHLLNQVRLEGPDEETVEQIVKLSVRYGIVTPYTSYLVTEPAVFDPGGHDRIIEEQMLELEAAASEPTFGRQAVEKAAGQSAMAEAEAPDSPTNDAAEVVRIVGTRTYLWNGDAWVDTGFDPGSMTAVKVPFLSANYFELITARPELAAGFALGPRVIAVSAGVAYEVVDEDAVVGPVDLPEPLSPDPMNSGENVPIADDLVDDDAVNINGGSNSDMGQGSNRLFGCFGGLLPLTILPVAIILSVRRRRFARVTGKERWTAKHKK